MCVRQADVHEEENLVIFYERKKKRTWQVYVTDATMKALMQIKREYPGTWLFPAPNPKHPICSKTAYNWLQTNLRKIGAPTPWPFHSLRATCYKLCQRAGWSVEMAARQIGDTVRVAQEHYSTPSMEEMKAVMREKAII